MSFALYGPVAQFTKTYTGYNECALVLNGDKIRMYLQGLGEWALYSLTFTKIRTIKSTTDGLKNYNLTVHRYGKAVPEMYTGYGDGQSPRCPPPYGTCGSELERYTYGSDTVELLCPSENCEEGNLWYCFYDARTNKLLCCTGCAGNKLYIIDPETKSYTKLRARNAGMTSHFNTLLLPYDDSDIYIHIVPYTGGNIGTGSLYKIKIDDLLSLPNNSIIEDYATKIADFTVPNHASRIMFTVEQTGWFLLKTGTNWLSVVLKPDGSVIDTGHVVPLRYFGTKYAYTRSTATTLSIIDITNLQTVQTITLPYSLIWGDHPVDPPFLILYDSTKTYVYLITYKGKAPVIQYDHTTRKFRVVDYITGQPLTAEVSVYRSRLCYPSSMYPLALQPQTLTVSDWTQVPSALKSECLTFAIKDIVVS